MSRRAPREPERVLFGADALAWLDAPENVVIGRYRVWGHHKNDARIAVTGYAKWGIAVAAKHGGGELCHGLVCAKCGHRYRANQTRRQIDHMSDHTEAEHPTPPITPDML